MRVRTVDAMVARLGGEAIRKSDLREGDRVLVVTQNSLYTIRVLGGGSYSISGGWFDRQGMSPIRISISGCTWGGAAIRRDIVAAPGLRIEFSNRVLTTPIRRARLLRGADASPGVRVVVPRAATDPGLDSPSLLLDLFFACYDDRSHAG